jgi:hypothetical protein
MTERDFCQARGLCPKYFHLRKQQLGLARKAPRSSPFVRVQKAPRLESARAPSVVLRLGRCVWELRDVSADWLVSVMEALA